MHMLHQSVNELPKTRERIVTIKRLCGKPPAPRLTRGEHFCKEILMKFFSHWRSCLEYTASLSIGSDIRRELQESTNDALCCCRFI